MVKFDILKLSCGKNLKKKTFCVVKFEKALVRRKLRDKGKNTLVWWKVKKILRFKIEKIQKNRKGKIQKKKSKRKNNSFPVGLDKMCVFCLYPIPDLSAIRKEGQL